MDTTTGSRARELFKDLTLQGQDRYRRRPAPGGRGGGGGRWAVLPRSPPAVPMEHPRGAGWTPEPAVGKVCGPEER